MYLVQYSYSKIEKKTLTFCSNWKLFTFYLHHDPTS